MTKTIEKIFKFIGNQTRVGNENKCKHEILRSIETQKGVGNLNNFFYCHYCTLRATVTDAYRQVLKDVYELRREVEEKII